MSSLCDPHQACLPRLSLKVHEHCIASSCPSLRVHEHCIASSCRSLRVHERLYCLLVYPWECLNHMIDIEIALIHTWGCMNHGIVSALSIHEGAWAITLLPCPSLRLLDPYDWHRTSINSYLRVHERLHCLLVHPSGCMSDCIASLSIHECAWTMWLTFGDPLFCDCEWVAPVQQPLPVTWLVKSSSGVKFLVANVKNGYTSLYYGSLKEEKASWTFCFKKQ